MDGLPTHDGVLPNAANRASTWLRDNFAAEQLAVLTNNVERVLADIDAGNGKPGR